MDALNYAAWVLKPTNDGLELNNQTPPPQSLPTAMSVDSDTATDASAVGAERTTSKKLEEAFEKAVEGAPLLFIDDEGEMGNEDAGNETPPDTTVVGQHAADGPADTVQKEDDKRQQQSKPEMINIPLLDYLCALNACTLKELQLLLYNVQARKHIITYLQQHCALRTAHLRPAERNQWLQCHDFSTQSVNHTYACNGYLELTVRQYFFAKHGLKLKHPYLPCLIEFGGGSHASYYPLEVINVVMEHTPLLQPSGAATTACPSAAMAEQSQRARRSALSTFGIFEVPPQFPTLYKSKNNTVKMPAALAEHVLPQPQATEKVSSENGGNGQGSAAKEMLPHPPPPPMHQKQRNGGVCCCCCCRCGAPSTSAEAGSPKTLLRRT